MAIVSVLDFRVGSAGEQKLQLSALLRVEAVALSPIMRRRVALPKCMSTVGSDEYARGMQNG